MRQKTSLAFLGLFVLASASTATKGNGQSETGDGSKIDCDASKYKPSDEEEVEALAETPYKDFFKDVCLNYRDFLFEQLEKYPKLGAYYCKLLQAHETSLISAIMATSEASKVCEYMSQYKQQFFKIFDEQRKTLNLNMIQMVQVNPGMAKCLTYFRMDKLSVLCNRLKMAKGTADFALDFAMGTASRYVFFNGLPKVDLSHMNKIIP